MLLRFPARIGPSPRKLRERQGGGPLPADGEGGDGRLFPSFVDRIGDGRQDGVKVGHYVAVGEAQDVEAFAFEVACAGGVVILLGRVGVTVDFDREHCGAAGEVDDVWSLDGLEAEFGRFEAFGAEVIPEVRFGRGRVLAHMAGAGEEGGVSHFLAVPCLDTPLSPALSPQAERGRRLGP